METFFYLSLFCHGAGMAVWVCRRPVAAKCFFSMSLAALSASLFLIVRTHGQWPVFHLFESLLSAAWMVQCWLVFHYPGRWTRGVSAPAALAAGEILVLFCVCLFLDKVAAESRFNHSYPWVIGFHGFRIASLAALLVASAYFIAGRRQLEAAGTGSARTLHSGRNFLLLAAVLFLVAEYTGLVWCQNGWGDIWHWSPGFFQSTLILLYLMAAFHIPGKISQARRIRTFLGAMGGFFVLGMMLLRSLI